MLTNASTVALADQLRLSVGRLARRLRQQSRGGLTPSQRSILATLDRRGPMTMGGLADSERISPPSATGIVGRLEESGLVERRPHPDDRRCAVVDLTTEGKELLEGGRRERTAYLAQRLEHLTADEREVLSQVTAILDRLAEPE